MARHTPKPNHAQAESRAARDHRLLTQARITARPAAPPVHSPDIEAGSDGGRAAVYTFNWETEHGSPLRLRCLQPEERPDLRSASLRLLVNLTAEGSPTPPDLQRALLQEPSELLAAAISEGIQRWHTYSQARS